MDPTSAFLKVNAELTFAFSMIDMDVTFVFQWTNADHGLTFLQLL